MVLGRRILFVFTLVFQKTLLQLKNVDKEITTILSPSTANKIERLWRQVGNSWSEMFA